VRCVYDEFICLVTHGRCVHVVPVTKITLFADIKSCSVLPCPVRVIHG
jgi:hypothetical protein